VQEYRSYLGMLPRSTQQNLTDGRLPDGTGLDVAGRAAECGTRVLLYTGYAHEFSPSRRAGLEVILKPLRIAKLLQHIHQTLEKC
jgi:hypothetical protein